VPPAFAQVRIRLAHDPSPDRHAAGSPYELFSGFFRKTRIAFLTFPPERGTFFGQDRRKTGTADTRSAQTPFRRLFSNWTQEIPVKDKSLLGFIVIDLLLAAGVVWGNKKDGDNGDGKQ